MGYSLQASAKILEGKQRHPDRNAQFEYVNALVKEFLEQGLPVISIVPVRVRPFFPQGLEDDSLNACMNIQSLQFVALAAAVRRWCRLPDLTRRVV